MSPRRIASKPPHPVRIEEARGLGPKSAAMLREVGIASLGDLQAAGAPMVYCVLRDRFPGVNAVMLWALQGAVEDRHWQSYDAGEKEALRREVEAVERVMSSNGGAGS